MAKLAVIIGGVLIIGGGVFVYVNYFPSPEKIVQKTTARLTETKSLEYSGEMKIEVDTGDVLGGSGSFLGSRPQSSNKKESYVSINFTGSSDIQNVNNPKGSFSFNIRSDALPQGESVFGLEVRIIEKVVYVALSEVPNIAFFDVRTLKNQWIKIDAEALKKQFGFEKLDGQVKEAQKKQELSPEQIEKLKTAVRQAKIFKTIEKLPSENIEGVNMYHYKFAIDEEGVKDFLADIRQIVQDKTFTEKERADLDKKFEAIESSEVEIWIGKKDLLPYKITLHSIVRETERSKISGKINFILFMKNFNKPVHIDIPQQAKPFEELLGELLGGFKGSIPNVSAPSPK